MTLIVTSLVPFLITGEGDDYLTVSLRDGGAAVGMTLAKGRLDLHIKPARVRFDDNQWHKIIVHRKVQEVMIMFLLFIRLLVEINSKLYDKFKIFEFDMWK